jgi:hypothetical protein
MVIASVVNTLIGLGLLMSISLKSVSSESLGGAVCQWTTRKELADSESRSEESSLTGRAGLA